jgi:AcrR family transcriptional regulator
MKFIQSVKASSVASSTTPTRRVRPPDERRRELLDAATALFAQRSASAVSVTDITSRAGVATGTFYRFFPTKEAILVDLRHATLTELRHRAGAVASESPTQDWWAAADRMVEELVGFWFEDPDRARVVLSGPTEDAAEAEAELLALFAAGLGLGQDLGVVNAAVDADIAASFILHGALGLVYHQLLDPSDGGDPTTLIAELQAQIHRLLST